MNINSSKGIRFITIFILFASILSILISCSNVPKQTNNQVENIEFKDIKFGDIVRIGIIPQISDKTKKAYVQKFEILITDQSVLSKFASLASKGKFELVITDRLPSEYILNLYFKDGKNLKAYYWIQCSQYNLTIQGISGSITVDGKEMDALITTAANEVGRERIEDPYKDKKS